MQNFEILRDNTGAISYGLPFADLTFMSSLTANTEITLTVPAYTNYKTLAAVFEFTPGANVWIANGLSPITLPTASFTATQGSLNPAVRKVRAGDTLRFITSDTSSVVSVSFYGIA